MRQEEIQAILEARAEKFRCGGEDASNELIEMIEFEQGGVRYAIPLPMLTEIRWVDRITPLALVSPAIAGVINVRGRIVAVYALGEGLAAGLAAENGCFVLVGHGQAEYVAIAASDIIGTLAVTPADMRTVPLSLSGKDYISGVSKDGLVFLDLDKFVNHKKLYMA